MKAPDQILTVAQMRAGEQVLIDGGESVGALMQRAGRGAADYVRRVAAGRAVTVLCGPGNNGGDGYVIARVLRDGAGLAVRVVAPMAPATQAAREARAAWGAEPVEAAVGGVFVDCLFGSGLSRAPSASLTGLLLRLAAQHEHCIAVDLPSGVDADSGAVLMDGLPRFGLTIALGAWKRAHWLMPASALMGERRLVDLGVAPRPGAARLIARPLLAAPPAGAHKYSRGMLAVVGGAMPGAALLAARAAMHGGAGYVKLLARDRRIPVPDELVVNDTPLGEALADRRINGLLVGPGLGRNGEAKARFISSLWADIATLCDADALHLLTPEMLARRTKPLVLTPHAGELAALCERFAIAAGPRLDRVAQLAKATGAVVVAKGPDTVVAEPGGTLHFARPAPSWLSIAGTGDVLAGLIASRLAAGAAPGEAARDGVWLHGEAARRSGAVFGASGLIAAIPEAYGACL